MTAILCFRINLFCQIWLPEYLQWESDLSKNSIVKMGNLALLYSLQTQLKSKVDDNLLMVDSYLRESSSTDTQKDSWALSLPSKQQQPKNRRRRTIKSKTQTLLLLGKNAVSYGGQNSPPKQCDVVYGSYGFSFTLMCELSWNSNDDKSLSRLCFRIGSRNVWKSKNLKMFSKFTI